LSEFRNCVLANNWHTFFAAVGVVGEMQTSGELHQQLTAMGP
jgi:hypothetical protein